jgi:hypothetical protein
MAKFRADVVDLIHQAPKLFGQLLDQLMLASLLSQHQLSKEATARRKELIEEGVIAPGDSLIGGMTQQTISKVIAGQQCPTYGQVGIWLDVIKAWYQSPKMFEKVAKAGLSRPRPLTDELEKNMWRLALFGTMHEIKTAYEVCKDLDLLEDRPIIPSHSTMNLQTSKKRQGASGRIGPNTDKLPALDKETFRKACEVI